MSLLKDAQARTVGNLHKADVSNEEIELTIAWTRSEITLSQATRAYSAQRGIKHGQGIYALFARALKKHINDKNIKL